MSMKIGICGAPCVGKTTLAKLVAEKLNIPFIGESFDDAVHHLLRRDLKCSKGPKELWPDYFKRVWFDGNYKEIVNFTKAIAWDLEEKERFAGDSFITDSASPSQAAAGLIYNTFLEETQKLLEWYNHQIERAHIYDYLFFIPYNKSIKLQDDKRRPLNKALQKQFDLMLPSILGCDVESDITSRTVWPTSIENRVKYICDKVGVR